MVREKGTHRTKWLIYKYKKGVEITPFSHYAVEEIDGNCLLNEGITDMCKLIIGDATVQPFNNANTYLGVGDSTTEAVATQEGLQASTNKTFKAMVATYPKVVDQTMYFRSVFGPTDAVYAWNEFTVVRGADDTGVNMNRKVQAKGTKADDTWILECQITLV